MDTFTRLAAAYPECWLGLLMLSGWAVGSVMSRVARQLPPLLEHRWRQAALRQLNLPAADEEVALWRRVGKRMPGSGCSPAALAHALLFMLVGLWQPPGWPLLALLLFCTLVLTLSIIDFNTMLLPDVLTLPLLWLGLLCNLNGWFVPLEQAVIGAAAGYMALWLLFWLFRLGSGKEALGYGDFKLTAALGAWCGWQSLPNLLLLAAGGGLAYKLLRYGWNKHSAQQPLAFGPWLGMSGLVNLLFFIVPINY
ncbi:prepilin peptidase [Serratia sp. JUb9]|uniref:prepilin peptidase n=1 Tax=Serratia sp. JUb9 TaxID=2724469 RepID=UPI00164DD7C4|nr:A24 family peptidase [Serratia sp. JUb9]QNK30935.1 prepilin peptidase [Serratia sp. JUb9]QPT15156.1 prepilin peptidase [Serratia rubidaea]